MTSTPFVPVGSVRRLQARGDSGTLFVEIRKRRCREVPIKAIGRILLGLYNILTTYLLGWVLFLACLAYGFEAATSVVATWLDCGEPKYLWAYLSSQTGIPALYLRLGIFVPLHAAILYFARAPLDWLQSVAESAFETVADVFRDSTDDHPKLAIFGRSVYTIGVTVVLVPFVLQPTLVRGFSSPRGWLERTANLADGTASANIVDSVAGAYRRLFVDDVPSAGGLDPDLFDNVNGGADTETGGRAEKEQQGTPETPSPRGERPMMDRWNPTIKSIADGDSEMFAYIKAFMWVESAGRQFAVSHTGCSGLMQFCAGTARRDPFRKVFGRGAVYACGCQPNCGVPDDVSQALETGNRDRVANLEDEFPCDLTDARFDGQKSLRAGSLYIEQLADQFGSNLFLMYIGYNSGPAVAKKVWTKIGRNSDAGLDAIEPHLADAMRPFFPDSAQTRASSLIGTHLPKLRRAYERYRREYES